MKFLQFSVLILISSLFIVGKCEINGGDGGGGGGGGGGGSGDTGKEGEHVSVSEPSNTKNQAESQSETVHAEGGVKNKQIESNPSLSPSTTVPTTTTTTTSTEKSNQETKEQLAGNVDNHNLQNDKQTTSTNPSVTPETIKNKEENVKLAETLSSQPLSDNAAPPANTGEQNVKEVSKITKENKSTNIPTTIPTTAVPPPLIGSTIKKDVTVTVPPSDRTIDTDKHIATRNEADLSTDSNPTSNKNTAATNDGVESRESRMKSEERIISVDKKDHPLTIDAASVAPAFTTAAPPKPASIPEETTKSHSNGIIGDAAPTSTTGRTNEIFTNLYTDMPSLNQSSPPLSSKNENPENVNYSTKAPFTTTIPPPTTKTTVEVTFTTTTTTKPIVVVTPPSTTQSTPKPIPVPNTTTATVIPNPTTLKPENNINNNNPPISNNTLTTHPVSPYTTKVFETVPLSSSEATQVENEEGEGQTSTANNSFTVAVTTFLTASATTERVKASSSTTQNYANSNKNLSSSSTSKPTKTEATTTPTTTKEKESDDDDNQSTTDYPLKSKENEKEKGKKNNSTGNGFGNTNKNGTGMPPVKKPANENANVFYQFFDELRKHTLLCVVSVALFCLALIVLMSLLVVFYYLMKYLVISLIEMCKRLRSCGKRKKSHSSQIPEGSMFARCEEISPYIENPIVIRNSPHRDEGNNHMY